MAEIIPFRGVRYNLSRISNLSQVITPPYDVIDKNKQKYYYEKSPYNIIRLEYGQIFPQDDENNNVYTRAASEFNGWLEQEILFREEQPALYLYEMDFQTGGEQYTRSGIFACVKVEDFDKKVILPHEETLSKPKEDRLNLLRTCKANFSPIFGLFSDREFVVEETFKKMTENPVINFQDEERINHRLWALREGPEVNSIIDLLKNKQIFIADGHHRYETALEFSKEMAHQKGYNYVLMGLVNLYNPGLVVLPTHRLVKNLVNFDLKSFLEKVSTYFYLEEFPFQENNKDEAFEKMQKSLQRIGEKGEHAFGLYGGTSSFYLLTLKDKKIMDQFNLDYSSNWKSLDVSILQVAVMENILDIRSTQRKNESNLTYKRDEKEALEEVDQGFHQLAFFLNPTRVEEIITVAGGGERMPQKSTFFYPKLVTGLVINLLPVDK
ncbi:MAG: DUF1015 domain-containing protein [Candidatus Syntrophonatronum acetioxidans]|uniref:DUF1015 domain-containing protein n=1 Tax=Candidatus Syntrophonatronum acetioxidans TaxID=1795816 RepID=A0A424YIE2_9FIRM|nr:MAG: DUF1015 domain-containing protein [Candidatus Syntrophonatronum acetioxidans]